MVNNEHWRNRNNIERSQNTDALRRGAHLKSIGSSLNLDPHIDFAEEEEEEEGRATVPGNLEKELYYIISSMSFFVLLDHA